MSEPETRIIRAGTLDALKQRYELHRRDGFLWTDLRELEGGGFELKLVYSPTANDPPEPETARLRGIVEPGSEGDAPADEPARPKRASRKRR